MDTGRDIYHEVDARAGGARQQDICFKAYIEQLTHRRRRLRHCITAAAKAPTMPIATVAMLFRSARPPSLATDENLR
eukprot:1505722-Pyramimonas_sp.AAC.1